MCDSNNLHTWISADIDDNNAIIKWHINISNVRVFQEFKTRFIFLNLV